jgi:hypothetical protein
MEEILGRAARTNLALNKRQCTATSVSGERCKNVPIPGGFVCRLHGGGVPATRDAARRRLLCLIDPAIDALTRALESAPPCQVCGRSDADRDPTVVRAAQLILDRVGFGPQASLLLKQEPEPPSYVRWLTWTELHQVAEIIARARTRMAAGEPPRPEGRPTEQPPEVAEGVVVQVEEDPSALSPGGPARSEGCGPVTDDDNILPVNKLQVSELGTHDTDY